MTENPLLPAGTGERFVGYGVMGMAFAGGHWLALRVMTATSIGPAYRAVWHRDPSGRWTIFTTIEPALSCPRYFGGEADSRRVRRIEVEWPGSDRLRVRIGDRLEWEVALGRTPATRLMSRMGRAMPESAWRSDALLGAMGPMAGATLRAGRVRLRGGTPNGQHFRAAPVRVWQASAGRAAFDGVDLGPPARLESQARLADFWLPQRGIFYAGHVQFQVRAEQRQKAGVRQAG